MVLPQPDGDLLVMHPDLEATVDELARWSAADAREFKVMMIEWAGSLAPVHGRWSSGLDLGESDASRAYRALRSRCAWDVIHERFKHPAVRSFLLWLAMATIKDPRRRAPASCRPPWRRAG